MTINNIMGFTCEDILQIPYFQDVVVLAGARGMQRTISRVNVMEVPDVTDWVRPGEFLITSGFPFRDEPETISEIIPQLVEKGVVALGIKTKRFVDHVPKRALELAEQLDFPVLQLPSSTVFSDVVRDIMERVLVQEARELSLLQSRFQKLSQQLLYGEGIEEFLESLDEMLNNPIVLLDDSNHVFLSPQAEEIVKIIGYSMDWCQLRNDINVGMSFMKVGERRIRVYISAVNNKKNHECLLILFEWNQEYSLVDQLTIDRVGILAGLELNNANARKEVESKYIDQFLQDWIAGRIVKVEDIKVRAEACGCSLEENHIYYVGLVRWINSKPTMQKLQQIVNRVRIKFFSNGIHTTVLEGELVVLFSVPTELRLKKYLGMIDFDLQSILMQDEQYSICLGKRVDCMDQVSESYRQAKKIHYISTICDLRESCIDYKHLGVFQLLYLLPDCEEVSLFRDRFIAPLLEYDSKHNTFLLETLKVYFKHNKNVKNTSLELFTHYNTVNYRIERVCEVLGIHIDSGEEMLQLHLAVKLHEIRPLEVNKRKEPYA